MTFRGDLRCELNDFAPVSLKLRGLFYSLTPHGFDIKEGNFHAT
jgi:hypothetical protein